MLTFFNLLISLAFALELPTGLNSKDQQRALEIVGLSTSAKFLSKSYPLGGYSGVELSLSLEALNTKEIAKLGDTNEESKNQFYPTLTIGKGIYNNSDVFFHFIPASRTSGISKYGLSFRYSFYQAAFLPVNISLVTNASSTNMSNQMVTRNLGFDLMVGMTLSQLSFYLGGGWANSSGEFTGGTSGVTSSGAKELQKVEASHFMFGGTYNFDPFFIGMAIDRYTDTVFTVKTGLLF